MSDITLNTAECSNPHQAYTYLCTWPVQAKSAGCAVKATDLYSLLLLQNL
jgi:hypothetical protein